jgi:hypothetical protein
MSTAVADVQTCCKTESVQLQVNWTEYRAAEPEKKTDSHIASARAVGNVYVRAFKRET